MLFQKLSTMNVKFDITIVNIIIGAFYRVRRNQEAKDLFATIPSNGLVANAVTYSIMMINLIKKGSVEEADNLFLSMEKSGCTADSCMLNHIIRRLLEQGEIARLEIICLKLMQRATNLKLKLFGC
uniref:Pentatricopeptide repeat-containing protein n=1 Tax=Hordeum vulgare subsp. vulgare TaxID=112509 RepID=A0A8I6WGM9_HORVV